VAGEDLSADSEGVFALSDADSLTDSTSEHFLFRVVPLLTGSMGRLWSDLWPSSIDSILN
jgi:hypothetical protein